MVDGWKRRVLVLLKSERGRTGFYAPSACLPVSGG